MIAALLAGALLWNLPDPVSGWVWFLYALWAVDQTARDLL